MAGVTSTKGVYFGRSSVIFSGKTSAPVAPTTVKVKEESGKFEKGKIAPWGSDNRYPQKFLDQLKLNGAASGGLSLLKAIHYGNGVTFFKNEKDENGKRTKQVQFLEDYEEIFSFWKRNKMPKFFTSTISDLETFSMAFPEYIISKDFQKITHVRRKKTAWCRRELINPSTGISEQVYLNANWEGTETNNEYTSKIHCMDPFWTADEIREYCKKKRIYKFVIPTHYTMTDETYYNKTSWHAVYHNGWMEVSNSIPKYKKYLFENQINIKYVVYISDQYFADEYGDDWEEYDVAKKKKIKEELITAIDEHLSGNESAGRTLFSKKIRDANGDFIKAIEIEPIDNLLKDGSFLPDASAANSEINYSQGVDSTLVGSGTPGGNMGAGSGSDKRIAFVILSALFKTKRETTLEIWEFLKEFNGWDEALQATFENMVLTTLDKNPTGQTNGI
jgi:hypothetical protein